MSRTTMIKAVSKLTRKNTRPTAPCITLAACGNSIWAPTALVALPPSPLPPLPPHDPAPLPPSHPWPCPSGSAYSTRRAISWTNSPLCLQISLEDVPCPGLYLHSQAHLEMSSPTPQGSVSCVTLTSVQLTMKISHHGGALS